MFMHKLLRGNMFREYYGVDNGEDGICHVSSADSTTTIMVEHE